MSFICIIAIDPGASGGICWNSINEGVQACAMPRDEQSVVKLLREILQANADHRVVAYIELVTGYVVKPKGKSCPACLQPIAKGEPGSRMFTFGCGAGIIKGALLMAGIEPVEVAPRTWQKPYYNNLLGPGGERKTKPERKRILHDIAQRRFPQLQVTLKTADALLIYAHGATMSGQELEGITGEEKPNVPVPFLEAHAEEFQELKGKLLPVAGSDVDHPGDRSKLFIGNWKGVESVFKRNGRGATFLHVADKHDLETLPRGNQ